MLARLPIFLTLLGLSQALPHGEQQRSNRKALNWAPCDEKFLGKDIFGNVQGPVDCTILEVPLDYTASDSELLSLQLIKKNATKQPFRGSVLFNPGGPGGSGLETVAEFGALYRDALGGHYDFVSWDPRGVGNTLTFKCDNVSITNSTNLTRRSNITVTIPQEDVYKELVETWDALSAKADACYRPNKDIGRLLGTTFVVKDMIEIIDALDEDGLLRYWGASYGTTLGQIFASMYPHRVGRLLVDSVQRARDYTTGTWLTGSRDTDDALTHAFQACIDAGSEKCSLAKYSGTDTTAVDLSLAFANTLQELIDSKQTSLYESLKESIYLYLYNPRTVLGALTLVEYSITGNWTAVQEYMDSHPLSSDGDALLGIGCADGAFRAQKPEDMYPLIKAQAWEGMFSDIIFNTFSVCSQWKFTSAEPFEGNFTDVHTNFPLMFANGAYDPITPLSGAFEASIGFKDSRLLQHHGFGHGVMGHPSNCTIDAIRKYFEDGILPEVGTTCEPNEPLYDYALSVNTLA